MKQLLAYFKQFFTQLLSAPPPAPITPPVDKPVSLEALRAERDYLYRATGYLYAPTKYVQDLQRRILELEEAERDKLPENSPRNAP